MRRQCILPISGGGNIIFGFMPYFRAFPKLAFVYSYKSDGRNLAGLAEYIWFNNDFLFFY